MTARLRNRLLFHGTLVLTLIAGGLAVLQACDTPVYRYAMYRWNPAPYEIYYFHSEPLSAETEAFHQRIKKLVQSREDQPLLNATLIPVDLSKDPELKQILPDIKQLWTQHKKQLSPGYLVTNPQGSVVSIGPLDQKQLSALTDSPTRRQLLTQLGQGKATVMVLLSGKDAAATDKAEKEVRGLVDAVNQGKVDLYQVPGEPAGDQEKPQDPPAKPAHQIGLLKLDRNDPAEAWLIQSLLSVEDDLKDFSEPMVFAVYGRARALPPYIGKGINRDNLLQCVEFVTGACSCTVKEQNPGVDLLVQNNWEAMAAKVAELFGAEEGNETQFGSDEFFPELIIGGGAPTNETTSAQPDLRIYCSSELRQPLGEIVRQYEKQHDVSIAVNYGPSAELLTMIEIAKTGDVYIAGDSSYFTTAEEKGLAEASIPLAKRRPVIAVAKNNTSISGIKELLSPQVNVAVGDPEESSIGRRTRQLLTASGDWAALLNQVTEHGLLESSVDDISDAIKQGRVSAGIVWDTTASNDPDLKSIPCPQLEAGESSIEIAVLSCSNVNAAAKQFTHFVASQDAGLAVFKEQGFRLATAQASTKIATAEETPADEAAPAKKAGASQNRSGDQAKQQPASFWIVGIGVLGAFVILFGITLLVMRPR